MVMSDEGFKYSYIIQYQEFFFLIFLQHPYMRRLTITKMQLILGTGGSPVCSVTARELRWSQEEVLQVPASVLTSGEYALLRLSIPAPTVKGHCSAHSESLWWAVLRKGTPLSLILCICAHGEGGGIFGSDSEALTVKHSGKPGPFPFSGNPCVPTTAVWITQPQTLIFLLWNI